MGGLPKAPATGAPPIACVIPLQTWPGPCHLAALSQEPTSPARAKPPPRSPHPQPLLLPPAPAAVRTSVGVNRGALKKDAGRSIAQRPVHHIAVSRNPADVSHAAKDVPWPVVKHKLQKQEEGLSGACHPFPHITGRVLSPRHSCSHGP